MSIRKKIDISAVENAQLTSQGSDSDLAKLKANGARALPPNPTANKWSAEAILKQLYKQPEILFAWLKKLCEAVLGLAENVDDALDDASNELAKIVDGTYIAMKAERDANSNVITTTYETKADSVHLAGSQTITGAKTFTANVAFGTSGTDNSKSFDIYFATNLRGPVTSAPIMPGNVGFSLGSAGHRWNTVYGKYIDITDGIKKGGTSYTLSLPNKSGTIAVESYVISEVAKIVNGDYTANKAKNDEDGNQIKTTYETKADAASKVLRSNLVTIIGEATQSLNGLMSSTDKSRLDALYAMLGTTDDVDTVVNTINEVLAIFSQYPEGVTLTNALALKVAFSDVINNLESDEISKPLSAYQGKVLNTLIASLSTQLNAYLVNAAAVAPIYDSSEDYAVGDFAIHNTVLYICNTAIDGGEEWNADHWTQVYMSDKVKEVETKITRGAAERDGTLSAGYADNADQLNSPDFTTDQVPYLYRTSGGDADIGNREKDTIVGGSLGWNQLVQNGNFANADNWSYYDYVCTLSVSNNVMTVTGGEDGLSLRQNLSQAVQSGHKILLGFEAKSADVNAITLKLMNGSTTVMTKSYSIGSSFTRVEDIISLSGAIKRFQFVNGRSNKTVDFGKVNIIDITACFGSTIADYIYSLETATAGTGVAWFRKLFPKPYYPFKAIGGFLHVKLTSHDMVGFNQFDKTTMTIANRAIQVSNGVDAYRQDFSCTDYIDIFQNTAYCFTQSTVSSSAFGGAWYDANKEFISGFNLNDANLVNGHLVNTSPQNAKYVRYTFRSSDIDNVCLNLSWSGWRNGQYEAYKKVTYPLDTSVILPGIPKLDADNNLYYDGNKYHNDGTVEEENEAVLVSELTIEKASNNRFASNSKNSVIKKPSSDSQKGVLFCTVFANSTARQVYENVAPMICAVNSNGALFFFVSETYYENHTAEQFKSDYGNVALVFKKATTTTSSADPFQETQEVDDFGTEEYVVPEQDGVQVPVGHYTEYPENLRDKLRRLPNMPTVSESTTATYVVNYNGQTKKCSFVPINDWLVANGYPTGDALKEVLASKEALGGTLRQLLVVKESLDFDDTAYLDLGDLSWAYANNMFSVSINVQLTSIKSICTKYKKGNPYSDDKTYNTILGYNASGYQSIVIKDSAYTDAASFKEAMKGQLFAYQKA